MKIVIATSTFDLNGGGVSSYAHDFLRVYNKKNKIIVITGDKYLKKSDDYFDLYHVEWNNWSISNAKYTIELLEKLNPDIVINSKAALLSLVSPYLNNKIKIINISHFVNGTLANIAGFNSRYVDTIVSLSTFGREYIERKFDITDVTKVEVIYNFMHHHPVAEAIMKSKIQNDELIIVYPGGSALLKSPVLVSKILFLLVQTDLKFKFYWLGNTRLPISWLFTRERTIKEIFPEDKRVVFTNRLSRQKAQIIIESANIFLLPSKGEGCPISLLEAMRVGTIPIVSDSKHASREIIKNGENGFVIQYNNIEEFVNTIKDIIYKPTEYWYIYQNCFKTFNNDFNEYEWKNKMDSLFNIKNSHSKRFNFKYLFFLVQKINFKCILMLDRYSQIILSVKSHMIFRKLSFEFKKMNKKVC